MVTKHVEGWWVAALLVAAGAGSGCLGSSAGTNRAVPPHASPSGEASAKNGAAEGAPVEPGGGTPPSTASDAAARSGAVPQTAGAGTDAAAQAAPTLAALRREAHRVIDDWHAAAAVGDAPRYLGHLAEDAVFMGTDATERWDLAAFRAYVEQHMTGGKGWAYVPSDRGLVVLEGSEIAWFDERLANEGYGELRGTGVLRRHGESWRIVHYSLTFTVPNAIAHDVAELIRGE